MIYEPGDIIQWVWNDKKYTDCPILLVIGISYDSHYYNVIDLETGFKSDLNWRIKGSPDGYWLKLA
jgi:hypothetical protein